MLPISLVGPHYLWTSPKVWIPQWNWKKKEKKIRKKIMCKKKESFLLPGGFEPTNTELSAWTSKILNFWQTWALAAAATISCCNLSKYNWLSIHDTFEADFRGQIVSQQVMVGQIWLYPHVHMTWGQLCIVMNIRQNPANLVKNGINRET